MLDLIFYLFIGICVLNICYYLCIFSNFSFSKNTTKTLKKIPISVIVCAKNEEEKIQKYLPLLVEQNYPDYEIVLINDASSDNTLEIFEEYQKNYPHVRIVDVENNEAFWGSKKYSLTLGIKAAKKEYLLFTDADCYPASKNWIAEMSANFTTEKTIILGYGAYEKVKNSFLNKLIRFETLLTAVQYFAWAKVGKPYMGVGRNLAYKKEEFFRVSGFMNHMKVRSGDDDLFINEAATAKNTTICFSPDSFTYSEPKKTFATWYYQKRRHTSTASYYKFFDKAQLGLFYLTQISFILLATILLALQFNWIIVTILVGVRYLATWLVLGFSAGKLKEKDVMIWYPILEIMLIFIQISIFFRNLISKPYHWK